MNSEMQSISGILLPKSNGEWNFTKPFSFEYDVGFLIDNKPMYVGQHNADRLNPSEWFRIYSLDSKNIVAIGQDRPQKWWQHIFGGDVNCFNQQGEPLYSMQRNSFWKWSYYINGNQIKIKSINSSFSYIFESETFKVKNPPLKDKYLFNVQESEQLLGVMCFSYISYIFSIRDTILG